MKCKVCGGDLKLVQGVYVCESCGSKSEITIDVDDTEVFLMYSENDSRGRRSKESIIAQEIYSKLTQVNVSVFYKRNIDNIIGEELHKMIDFAYSKSKIVIIIGTTAEAFSKNVENEKTIIPVYADVDICNLPMEIQKLQALNYNNIGAVSDLVKNVLSVLGREESINIISEAEKKRKRRKQNIIILAALAAFAVITSVVGFVFFTPYILPENQYQYAQKLFAENKYLEAIDWFNKNPEYKNTKDLLKSLYDRYDGDYLSDDKKTMLSLNILNGTSADVSFSQNIDDRKIKFSASTTLKGNVIDFQFTDNNSMLGTGKIELSNRGVYLILNYPDDNSYNYNKEFTFEQKGNANEHDSGMREELLSLFNPNIYPIDFGVPFVNVDRLIELGYNISTNYRDEAVDNEIKSFDYATKDIYKSETLSIPTDFGDESYYADYNYLKNYHFASYYGYAKDAENDIIFELDASGFYENNHNVLSVFGKASLLTPDKIGKKPVDFTENGVVYSFVNAKDVLERDDWVNITFENKNYLKEYNNHMNAIKRINNTDFNNYESVNKLNCANISMNDFMLSKHKLEYSHRITTENGVQKNVYLIVGTNIFVTFDTQYIGEECENVCKFLNLSDYPEYFGEFTGGRDENQNAGKDSLYRVRKSANDSASQIGAYKILENAKKDADAHKAEGYKVYDDNGKVIYEP